MTRTRAGFTLMEILIVVAIILVLTAFLLPVISKVQEKARQTNCLSNQHQLSLALLSEMPNNAFLGTPGSTDASEWTKEIQLSLKPGKVWHCPANTADAAATSSDYGMNGYLYGLPMSAIKEPSRVVMLADAVNPLLLARADVATSRHDKGYIATFVDGHGEWLNSANPKASVLYGPGDTGVLLNFAAEHALVTFNSNIAATGESTTVREGSAVLLTNAAIEQITPEITVSGGDTAPAQGLNPATADLVIKPGFSRAFALYCYTTADGQKADTTYTFGQGSTIVTLQVIAPVEVNALPQ